MSEDFAGASCAYVITGAVQATVFKRVAEPRWNHLAAAHTEQCFLPNAFWLTMISLLFWSFRSWHCFPAGPTFNTDARSLILFSSCCCFPFWHCFAIAALPRCRHKVWSNSYKRFRSLCHQRHLSSRTGILGCIFHKRWVQILIWDILELLLNCLPPWLKLRTYSITALLQHFSLCEQNKPVSAWHVR